jgi:putative nucleotidyltransferase with HDIG domain
LPLAVLTTALVIVLPASLVAVIVPRGGLLLMALSAASAVALSTAFASAGAAVWKRRRQSRDIIFADLMLWGWLRRSRAERGLAQAQALYDSAKKAGLNVSIELLEDLSGRLEARDAYTHGHNQRVARHAERIARAMHLTPAEIAKVRTAATVHDVGKIYTPREILNNPGRLTDREYAIVKLHAADGAEMLAAVGDPEIAAIVRHHHERLDGHGYPDALAGSEIPLGARIIAVADTFDAITSNRAYRSAGTQKKALDVLCKEAGSQLDPAAVTAFLSCYSSRRSVAWFALATSLPPRILEGLQTIPAAVGISPSLTILPAIGAAGLLALSHGPRPTIPIHQPQGTSAITAEHSKPAIKPAPTTDTTVHATRQIGTARRTSRHANQSRKVRPDSPTTPRTSTPARASPIAGSTAPPSKPVATKPGTPPRGNSPLPTPPESTPPVGNVPQLPVPSSPQLPPTPSPPVALPNPPVTLPKLPVTIPTVSTPVGTVSSIATPTR